LAQLGWHARRFQRWIDLEGQGLVGKVQEMWVGVDAGVRVLGGVVIAPGDFRIVVVRHDGASVDGHQHINTWQSQIRANHNLR